MQFWKNYGKCEKTKEVCNKLVTTEKRTKPNYHTTNFFSENLLVIELRKTQ